MKYYTGVGSRQTPPDVLNLMAKVAGYLAARGWTLRSGHAQGADRAFELEAHLAPTGPDPRAVIYLPWEGFGQRPYKGDPGMQVFGEQVIPTRDEAKALYDVLLKLGVRNSRSHDLLHGRNVLQVCGHNGQPNSRFVVCWCPERAGIPQGGTATAVNLARVMNVPVFNLYRPEDRARVEAKIKAQACP